MPTPPPRAPMQIQEIRFESIVIGRQIRQFFGDIENDLVAPIDAGGYVAPLIVRPLTLDDEPEEEAHRQQLREEENLADVGELKYHLIAGERRYKALRILRARDRQDGLDPRFETVRAEIYTGNDPLEIMLLNAKENLGRKELTYYEVAVYCGELRTRFGLSSEEVAEKLGLSKSYVNRLLRVLKLDPYILNHLKKTGGVNLPLTLIYGWSKLQPEQQREAFDQWLGLSEQPAEQPELNNGNRANGKKKMRSYKEAKLLLKALTQAGAEPTTLAAVRYLMGERQTPPIKIAEEEP